MQTLFDFMRRYRREDGSELCETFVRAPKRRTDPEYYEVVTDPIDMLKIQNKLKTDEYSEMKQLQDDFDLLFNNALSFYKKGSQEHKDAKRDMVPMVTRGDLLQHDGTTSSWKEEYERGWVIQSRTLAPSHSRRRSRTGRVSRCDR